jgi:hypothetical protein
VLRLFYFNNIFFSVKNKMQTIIGMIPNKYLIPAALLASANKRLIIPTAKKVATGVSTSLGILTEE